MSERIFVCLDCGAHTDSFLEPCPECESTQFESATDHAEEKTLDRRPRQTHPPGQPVRAGLEESSFE